MRRCLRSFRVKFDGVSAFSLMYCETWQMLLAIKGYAAEHIPMLYRPLANTGISEIAAVLLSMLLN